jgi:phosphatidate phosphatase APP1
MADNNLSIRIYHGYGHADNLIVFGHVLRGAGRTANEYANGVLPNMLRLLRLFFVKPVAGARVRLARPGGNLYATTGDDGFFKFEWQENDGIPAGWHTVQMEVVNGQDAVLASGSGSLFVPHITQYGFISDIDDTVLVSYSATILKRLKVLLFKNPHTRTAFPDVAEHYRYLSKAQTKDEVFNPFYYVSSSEWNLYNDLVAFFRYNKLPEGVFLLNQIKRWYQFVKTGKTSHEGKLTRIVRIMEAFPNQQFVLLGDNSQKDPYIYEAVAKKYAGRIYAIYIRNVHAKKSVATKQVLHGLEEKNIHTCLYSSSSEAIAHSKSIGLIA